MENKEKLIDKIAKISPKFAKHIKPVIDIAEQSDEDVVDNLTFKRKAKIWVEREAKRDEAHARRHRILMLISELWERHPEMSYDELSWDYVWRHIKGKLTDAELEANLKEQLKKEVKM